MWLKNIKTFLYWYKVEYTTIVVCVYDLYSYTLSVSHTHTHMNTIGCAGFDTLALLTHWSRSEIYHSPSSKQTLQRETEKEIDIQRERERVFTSISLIPSPLCYFSNPTESEIDRDKESEGGKPQTQNKNQKPKKKPRRPWMLLNQQT